MRYHHRGRHRQSLEHSRTEKLCARLAVRARLQRLSVLREKRSWHSLALARFLQVACFVSRQDGDIEQLPAGRISTRSQSLRAQAPSVPLGSPDPSFRIKFRSTRTTTEQRIPAFVCMNRLASIFRKLGFRLPVRCRTGVKGEHQHAILAPPFSRMYESEKSAPEASPRAGLQMILACLA